MKHYFFMLIFCFTAVSVFAQIKEGKYPMSQGLSNGFQFEVKTNKKEAMSIWKDYADKFDGKTKTDKKSNEVLSDDCTIKQLSKNTVDVYAQFNEKGNNCDVYVFYDLGGAYLNSDMHANAAPYGKSLLEEYVKLVDKTILQEELKKQEKLMKDQVSDLSKLVNKKSNLEEDIVKYEKKIEEAKNDIQKNLQDQKVKENEIKNQESVVTELKGQLSKF